MIEKILTLLFVICGVFIIVALAWLLVQGLAPSGENIMLETYVLCASAAMYVIKVMRFGRRQQH